MIRYYAARSEAELEEVCSTLQGALGLPAFVFDGHDYWRYAHSGDGRLHINITEAEDDRTIETWTPDSPSGVNYQIILTAIGEPAGFLPRLSHILPNRAVQYAESDAEPGEEEGIIPR